MIAVEFCRPVKVDRLRPAEKVFTIEASEKERQALAERFRILGVEHLSAEVALRTQGGLVLAKGRFAADVVQACVVSLAPVAAHVEETFELAFSAATWEEESEVVVDAEGEDPPEPIVDGTIDIGEATAEHLALALDPFPRAPGAEFAAGESGEAPAERQGGAFDALAEWKK